MIAIIGAGPIGLYLAYKLKTAGVDDLVIFDPRAGSYVRPGHVIPELFELLQKNLNKTLWPEGKHGHIKDVERILYKEVTGLGITIRHEQFIRFNNSTTAPAIIVRNAEGVEHIIPCTYAFDCTGASRALINCLNNTIVPAPFSKSLVSDQVVVANHCLAYVYMNTQDFNLMIKYDDDDLSIKRLSPVEYTTSINRLRVFGWTQFTFPRCYGERFATDKVCLYLEAPDNLKPQFKEAWVQTVLKARTGNQSISFQQLPPSEKYKSKPRLTSFIVNPVRLNQSAFKKEGLPVVIATGDTLCDPLYFLAHGIEDGMSYVNTLLPFLTVTNGTIGALDNIGYEQALKPVIDDHAQELTQHYQQRSEYFKQYAEYAAKFTEQAPEKVKPQARAALNENTANGIRFISNRRNSVPPRIVKNQSVDKENYSPRYFTKNAAETKNSAKPEPLQANKVIRDI